ncbi:DNA mismatch repair protein-like protein [Hapsidospora chrysogenum ATCC 11550]|uniref:DNA mismatch repair protein n=1 Tax=Hapsidospora chrysogenum (strain ATCC 11550 / CBS 779.69 / DSM 880 / IAM 14645 / JCM 23072 / IMI 49137) TaxID=857340 RepID=A0A086TDC0_HAPC1|nr:DNA mismatch repair protein-like protein [Hapsidospora chrysogenum ATCC 11550]
MTGNGSAGASAGPARTPAKAIARNSASSSAKQQSIMSFFQKSSPGPASSPLSKVSPDSTCLRETTKANTLPKVKPTSSAKKKKLSTPVPSSDALEPPSSQENTRPGRPGQPLPSPTPMSSTSRQPSVKVEVAGSSPSRKAKKVVSYAESSDDDEPFAYGAASQTRRRGRARKVVNDEDVYGEDSDATADDDGLSHGLNEKWRKLTVPVEDMDDFIASDDSDEFSSKSKKRKRPSKPTTSRKRSNMSPPSTKEEELLDLCADELMEDLPPSTARQWNYDPDSAEKRPVVKPADRVKDPKAKVKAHTREPEDRYPWLANIRDKEKRTPDDPEYDPRTIYIPPLAWNKFSPFEKQYWEIKQNHWDTIVFFKKGKFYELYENDATIGHQEFDFKMTDRVNMRMVGVPESSLDHWVNQFIAKQYKVARVDQMETNLGKEMRERQDKTGKKADKVITRQLACVLTAGTLVDGGMLQDDMAAYCVAIKESVVDDMPAFGVAFVDTATGRFHVSGFVDDADRTKFETLIAQTSPRELLLEKSRVSTKTLRILKNNTSPTTIWTHLRPVTEFWDADTTVRELNCGNYFITQDGSDDIWPETLQQYKDDELVMSAVGGLVSYLKFLKLERPLLSQGSFESYSPIQKNGTLILDGQTLVNLELFANSVNGGPEGTLFSLLNKCVTPFGKRMFRQWVAHPLCDIRRINERLDAVEMLNSDPSVREQFASQLVKMPDLERLISRIHAGACKPEDFVRVLEGFEQIEYTMSLLEAFKGGEGIVDQLVSSMPSLAEPLNYWRTAFDRRKARDEKLLIPERGIEEDFDESLDRMDEIKAQLKGLLDQKKVSLKCKTLKYTDIGKEIYQLEAPKSVKVPSDWRQMSSTKDLRRWYFDELTSLVRDLQEAEETHSQLVKEVAARFFQKFDVDYEIWLKAVKIVAQLDCLVSLARASSSLGQPSCRPDFVDENRSVVDFEELRHPCMINTVDDFIPNDIKLGGNQAKINLLTGANAAGKSTVLRMSCIAVIMAQIGCFVPASSARLTPVDRIMSRLGANDNIFAAQSTFFVELAETKKILSEATPRSLVILDELGRGTSSYDGVAVAQAVLHHVATHIGCIGFFATHYHSLAVEFENHPEIRARRMQIDVDEEARRVTFLYKLEDGVAEGSFGMHCAAMCGISSKVIERAEVAAREWEHTSRLKDSLERAKTGCYIPLGILSDVGSLLGDKGDFARDGMDVLLRAIEGL